MSNNINATTTPMAFARQMQEFKKFKDNYPRYVGNMAVNFFKDSFNRGGFIDQSMQKWKARQPGWGKKEKAGRAILVKSGRLRRSIRVISTGLGYVKVGTDVPYARIHNEGGTIRTTQHVGSYTRKTHKRKSFVRNWKGHSQKIKASKVAQGTVSPHKRRVNISIEQRRFMGQSQFLNKRILMNTEHKIKQILNTR